MRVSLIVPRGVPSFALSAVVYVCGAGSALYFGRVLLYIFFGRLWRKRRDTNEARSEARQTNPNRRFRAYCSAHPNARCEGEHVLLKVEVVRCRWPAYQLACFH